MRSTPESTQERCQAVVRAKAVQERREHTGSAGSEAPSVPKKRGAEMATQTHQQPQRERECHITMPYIQNTGWGLKRQSVNGMEGDRHMGDEVRQ